MIQGVTASRRQLRNPASCSAGTSFARNILAAPTMAGRPRSLDRGQFAVMGIEKPPSPHLRSFHLRQLRRLRGRQVPPLAFGQRAKFQ